MSLLYISNATMDEAKAIDQPKLSEPFPGIAIAYVLTQDFMQNRADWSPLPFNTPHDDPTYSDYLLVQESALQDVGGGMVRWTRTYAKVPDSYNEPAGNYSYNFIGFVGSWGVNVTTVTGRDRFTRNVLARMQRDFFLVDSVTGDPGGPVYDDWANIPEIPPQRYLYDVIDVDFVADSPPLAVATDPSRTEYQDMIDGGQYIVAENSRLSRWMGNIYVRETISVKAQ